MIPEEMKLPPKEDIPQGIIDDILKKRFEEQRKREKEGKSFFDI